MFTLRVSRFDIDSVVEIPVKNLTNGKSIAAFLIGDGCDLVEIEDKYYNRVYILDNKGTYTP